VLGVHLSLRKTSLSETQLSALADAMNASLRLYRRGYAATKLGPFHADRTVKSLSRRGLMDISLKTLRAKATDAGRKLMNELSVSENDGRPHNL